uniref:BHLH domain-containing protein n=1 Tax=Kalanchoe fedtschenkoi TaxID=63787 RepID=A0A7N0UZR9_KALFE
MLPGASSEKSELYRIMTGMCSTSFDVGSSFLPSDSFDQAFCDSSSESAQRALAALRNHKEAEKRRRERINSHLDKLRSILPCSSKTDKASLLAKVVERVRELKQEAAMMEQTSRKTESYCLIPSESDEVTVYSSSDDGGRLIFKASLCCEDRSDLMPELIGILKSLRLKTLRAEMCTVGGRIRNVLVVAADSEHSIESIHFLQSALKGLVQKSSDTSADRSKRRRMAASAARQLRS